MFTGLVQTTAQILSFEPMPNAWRLRVQCQRPLRGLQAGDSVALNGACLTLIEQEAGGLNTLSFEVLEETKRCTQLDGLRPGALLNVEPSIRAGDFLGGHFVTGHVDGVGRVESLSIEGRDTYMRVFLDKQEHARYIVSKGCIALNGVSLTVVDPGPDSLGVWLIPHTLKATNLCELKVADPVNLEYDLLAKYVARTSAYRDI